MAHIKGSAEEGFVKGAFAEQWAGLGNPEYGTQGLQQQEVVTTLSLKGRAVKSWICGRAAQTRVLPNHRQAGPSTRGQGHCLSFTSYSAATPIGQTHLKAKELVT